MKKLLILTLLLVGCGKPFEITPGAPVWDSFPVSLSIDMSVSNAYRDGTLNAINEWEEKTGIDLFTITSGSALIAVSNGTPDMFEQLVQGLTFLTWSGKHILKAPIMINTNQWSHPTSLMLHELGHSLGLQHTKKGVMLPSIGYGEIRDTLDSTTLNYFNELYH